MAETLAAQGSQRIDRSHERLETAENRPSDDRSLGPREEKGRLSNPPQRRLSSTEINHLVDAYRAGASISQLATDFGIHRTAVAAHLDRNSVPRHHDRTAWDNGDLEEAAKLYAAGLSLADVGAHLGVDAQTVPNRF